MVDSQLLVMPKPDGRPCRCCQRADNSKDHVFEVQYLCWGYPPNPDGTSRGRMCFYCLRVYEANYQATCKRLGVVLEKIGIDAEFNKEFHFFRDAAVKFFREKGKTRGLYVNWGEFRIRVVSYRKEEEEEVEAPITIKPLVKYMALFGDPSTNGLVHTRIIYRGIECVSIPPELEWKVYKKRTQGVVEETEQQNSDMAMSEGQLDKCFSDLAAGLFVQMPLASGVSLDSLLASAGSGSASSSSGIADKPSLRASEDKATGKSDRHDADEDEALMGRKRSWSALASATAASSLAARAVAKAKGTPEKPAGGRVADGKAWGNKQVGGGEGGGIDKRGRPQTDKKKIALEHIKIFQSCAVGENTSATWSTTGGT